MKKFSKLVAFATSMVALTAFTMFGCSDISSSDDDSSATVSSGIATRVSSSSKVALTINVEANSDLVKFPSATDSSSRTITPDALDSGKVKFYLGGTDLVTNKAMTIQEVTFTADSGSTTKGKVTVDLDPSNYRFTLVALPKLKTTDGVTSIDESGSTKAEDSPTTFTTLATYVSNAVLIGYANADLRYTTESEHINFKMTSDGLSGNGTLDLKFYLKGWSSNSKAQRVDASDDSSAYVIASATIGLYNIRTGALVAESNISADFTGKESESDTVAYTGGSIATSLAAGTYDVRVTFTRTNTEGVAKSYVFGDSVMILPSQVTSATLGIPDLLPLAPAAPTELTVGYLTPDDGTYNDSDYYKVIFNWKEDDTDDASKVEQYFEIQLYDITNLPDESAITPAALGTAGENKEANWASSDGGSQTEAANENTYRYNTNFYGMTEYYFYTGSSSTLTKNVIEKAPTWYCGSLQKDNHSAGFYVELGKRYLARIRAVNDVDKSAWTYSKGYGLTTAPTVTLTKDVDVTREDSSIGTTVTKTANKFNTDIINLFRMKYELNGGSFTGAIDQVYYFDQLLAGNPIMVPDGSTQVSLVSGVENCGTQIGQKKAPYNDGTAITLKDSTNTQNWVSWKLWGSDGSTTAYPNKFETASAYAASTTYYVTETLDTADINGSTTGYKLPTTQPTSENFSSATYYTDSGKPEPYKGYKNLTLYANYQNKTTFTVEIANKADYKLETNVDFKVVGSGGGEGTQPTFGAAGVVNAYDSITVNRSGKDSSDKSYTTTTLTFSWALKSSATVKYDKVVLTLDKQGGSSSAPASNAYEYDMTSGTAKVNISQFTSQTIFAATLKAYTQSNPNAPYELPITIRIN